MGNRLSSLGVSPYSYNASNELTSIPGTTYGYDNNGNLQTKTDATGTTTYSWDYENRLTQVALPGTGGTVTFKYDPFGRRAQKAFVQGGSTTTTNYLYDGDGLLEELDQSGNVLARYTQGPPLIDEPLSELRVGLTSYYEQDGVRTVTSLSNSSGGLANTYTLDSFGKMTASTGTLANPFQYTGRQFDSETGVYYYRARYYDQSVGRFLSEDQLKGVSDGVNFYPYVQNNPANLIDPSGLRPECACAPVNRFRLVPISDCHHGISRRIVYDLQGPGASNWWVTEHQNPTSWAPATQGSPQGQSTDQGGFDDTIYGWAIGNSLQSFTISQQDPRKFPNIPSCPVDVALPLGPKGQSQDYRTLGIWHGNPIFINGNSSGWVPCNNSYEVPGYGH